MHKSKIDKDLKRFHQLEKAATSFGERNLKLGVGLLFLVAVWIFAAMQTTGVDGDLIVIAAAVIGGYMALNIGANDVANNVGPAVGSKALTMTGALIIAAICEASGALFAGGDVVATVSKNIIDAGVIADNNTFILAMMSALLAAALWINLATVLSAPVSTTHAVVGGVMGAGIAAVGVVAVNWPVMGAIAASWVISPVMGGVIAAMFLAFLKKAVLYKEDKITAAKRWVPILVAIMASAFTTYFVLKGLKKIWKPDGEIILLISISAFFLVYFIVRRSVQQAAVNLENRRKSVNELFTIPLIFAAAMLSFAHGANDVANAVGPLAAIVNAVAHGNFSAKVDLQPWVLAIGAVGIAAGLMLFGPKIIQVVGEKITKLNRTRAFCVALSAAITVIIASGLGLPVSSTHIAVGAVFGVGFLREFIQNRRRSKSVQALPVGADATVVPDKSADRERKARKRLLVRRRHLSTIVAAWIITVPASAILSGMLFYSLNALFY
ncbi:MAG: inorganic phosphate transporter [Gammaproteobacteria bacterium]|jgi:PiT family inorganic phosphate transporter